MAKIKYSALVSDMRNKLNGSVMSANRYGSYVRNKVTPVNPQSVHQQNARQRFGALSSSFRDLTLAQIKAWNNEAKNFPFTDIFGDTKHLSGQSLFVKLNSNLEKVGQPRISNPPTSEGFPEFFVEGLTADLDNGATNEIVLMTSLAAVPAGYSLAIYATESVSRSINFVKNRFRFLGTFAAATGAVDITDEYVERFGDPLGDQVIHIRCALVSNESGQQSTPSSVSSTVSPTP